MNKQTTEIIIERLNAIENKIDSIQESHNKLDKNFNVFKVKAYMFIAMLVGAKEAILRKFIG